LCDGIRTADILLQKLSLWTVENGYLRASFDIVCSKNRQMVRAATRDASNKT